MKILTHFALGALTLGLAATAAHTQILRLDLDGMISRTENAVYAEIVDRKLFRVDHPIDGPELYFTTLTLRGESLLDGTAITTKVTFPGGYDPETGEGVWNSEAPNPDDVRVGNRIVAFYKWVDNMGGDVQGNVLYAAHGGLFRTTGSANGTVVLGRGDGYAVSSNVKLTNLRSQIATIRQAKQQK